MRRNEVEKIGGIYVHVPFCRRKCFYCDFYSVGERLVTPRFVKSLTTEYRQRKSELDGIDAVTLYIGGGTPSLLLPDYFKVIREMVELPVREFTIEVNPDDVTSEKAEEWRRAGVDRLSMGVQSLVDEELKAIGRRHDSARATDAYGILRPLFPNISLDLMFGLPGQTLESLNQTIEGMISMRPEHISAYSLMYEERTVLTRMRDSGSCQELPEEDMVRMFQLVNEKLTAAGYERYEISNYALPGYRSGHNSNYWRGLPYLGLGPAAHSYDGRRTRRFNKADVNSYIEYYLNSLDGSSESYYEEECLSDNELREEMIMTRLRTIEGLDLGEFESRFGKDESLQLEKKARRYMEKGTLQISDGRLRLTDSGVMISDEIMSSLF